MRSELDTVNRDLEMLTVQAEAVAWEMKYIQQRFGILNQAAKEIESKAKQATAKRAELMNARSGEVDNERS